MAAVLGVDLGGTVVKAAVVEEDGHVLSLSTSPSAESLGVEAWASVGVDTAFRALEQTEMAPLAVGLSVPGAIDSHTATMLDLVSRLGTGGGIALRDYFAPLCLPVEAENDARAALAAERRWGAAKGVENVVLLTLGTGLGGAVYTGGVVDERVLVGNQIGHFIVDLDGPACVCGNNGCAETYASATGLKRMATEASLCAQTVPGIFSAAACGDQAAATVVDRFVLALGTVVVNAVHAYQPDLVVLAGGVMGSAPHFLTRVQDFVSQRAWTIPRGRVSVVSSALTDRIGVLGAAAVAFDRLASTTTSRRAS